MYISTKARARKHGCSLWQILMCSLFSCCCLQQKCLKLYIFEVDNMLLFAKGKNLPKQDKLALSKRHFKRIFLFKLLYSCQLLVILRTISTKTLNKQARGKLFLTLWFSNCGWFDFWWKKYGSNHSKSRISVWTTDAEIVVALLCEKDLTRFYYIQILFYGNDVSSQENNGTNSILLVHSSEKSCLWLMKCFLKTLQNLRYFWNTKSHVLLYFFISCCINISPDECLLF